MGGVRRRVRGQGVCGTGAMGGWGGTQVAGYTGPINEGLGPRLCDLCRAFMSPPVCKLIPLLPVHIQPLIPQASMPEHTVIESKPDTQVRRNTSCINVALRAIAAMLRQRVTDDDGMRW